MSGILNANSLRSPGALIAQLHSDAARMAELDRLIASGRGNKPHATKPAQLRISAALREVRNRMCDLAVERAKISGKIAIVGEDGFCFICKGPRPCHKHGERA